MKLTLSIPSIVLYMTVFVSGCGRGIPAGILGSEIIVW